MLVPLDLLPRDRGEISKMFQNHHLDNLTYDKSRFHSWPNMSNIFLSMLLFSELPCWFSTACGTSFAWRKILVVIQTNFGLRMPDSNTFPLFCFFLINSWSSKSLRFQLPNILRHLEVFYPKKDQNSRICAEPSTLTAPPIPYFRTNLQQPEGCPFFFSWIAMQPVLLGAFFANGAISAGERQHHDFIEFSIEKASSLWVVWLEEPVGWPLYPMPIGAG